MHPLINTKMVERIRAKGEAGEKLPDRVGILREYGLPFDRPAENVILSGCMVLARLTHVLRSLARFFDGKGFSYTFLSKEYCCGNYLYRPAIQNRDEAAMGECRQLSKEFVGRNIEQGKKLGGKRTVIFCSPCYPIYREAFPEEDIIFYPAAISEIMGNPDFPEKIDYYAGCYRLHRKFSDVPFDLKSTDEVFNKIKGLDVHRIAAPKCCFTPEGLSAMIDNVRTKTMVHICTGCYGQAKSNMPEGKGTEILMLPEFVERVVG